MEASLLYHFKFGMLMSVIFICLLELQAFFVLKKATWTYFIIPIFLFAVFFCEFWDGKSFLTTVSEMWTNASGLIKFLIFVFTIEFSILKLWIFFRRKRNKQ